MRDVVERVVAECRERDRTASDPRPADVDPDEYEVWPDDAPDDHRVVTSGFASTVFDAGGEVVGHVTVLDLDDCDPCVALGEADRLDGAAVAFRSSPGCYLVLELTVRSWPAALYVARSSDSCQEYVDEMDDRGRFVMRTQPKLRRGSGDVYKPAPEPLYVSPGEGPVSHPHVVRTLQLAEDLGVLEVAGALRSVVADVGTVGRTLTQSSYETMTDELREVVGRGE